MSQALNVYIQLTKRLDGWWGNDPASRFEMAPTFRPTPGAKSFQHSCTPVFSSIPLLATLELIDKIGFSNMVAKGRRLTDTLESLLRASKYHDRPAQQVGFRIITPAAPWRGSQLSLFVTPEAQGVMPRVFSRMLKRGLVGDERQPNVIRLTPAVLYNTFEEVGRAVAIIEEALEEEEREGGSGKEAERDIVAGDSGKA
jgi:kynureninase